MLASDYLNEFPHAAKVLYTCSNMDFDESDVNVTAPVFSYLGNLGLDRPLALVEISEVLQTINSSYKLDVYGKCTNEKDTQLLNSAPGINYKGFVSYLDVKLVMNKSTILFHAETQDKQYQECLKYGFSTKIADSISSGHPFIMYVSPNIAGAEYIIKTGAGWFADNKAHLKQAIIEILNDKNKREQVKAIARSVKDTNHNRLNSHIQMKTWLFNLCNSH